MAHAVKEDPVEPPDWLSRALKKPLSKAIEAATEGAPIAHKDVGEVLSISDMSRTPSWVKSEVDQKLWETLKGWSESLDNGQKEAPVLAAISGSPKGEDKLLLDCLGHIEPFGATGHVETEGEVDVSTIVNGVKPGTIVVKRRIDHKFMSRTSRKWRMPRTWMPSSWTNHEGKTLTRERYEEGQKGGYYTNTFIEGVIEEYAMVGAPAKVYRNHRFPAEPETLKAVAWVGATHAEDPAAWEEVRRASIRARRMSVRSRKRKGREIHTKYKHNQLGVYRPPPSVLWFCKNPDGMSNLNMPRVFPEYQDEEAWPHGTVPVDNGAGPFDDPIDSSHRDLDEHNVMVIAHNRKVKAWENSGLERLYDKLDSPLSAKKRRSVEKRVREKQKWLTDQLRKIDENMEEVLQHIRAGVASPIDEEPPAVKEDEGGRVAVHGREGNVLNLPAPATPVLEGEYIEAAKFKPSDRDPNLRSESVVGAPRVIKVNKEGVAEVDPEAFGSGGSEARPIDATGLGGKAGSVGPAANDENVDYSVVPGRQPGLNMLDKPVPIVLDPEDPATIDKIDQILMELRAMEDDLVYTKLVLQVKHGKRAFPDIVGGAEESDDTVVGDFFPSFTRARELYSEADAIDSETMTGIVVDKTEGRPKYGSMAFEHELSYLDDEEDGDEGPFSEQLKQMGIHWDFLNEDQWKQRRASLDMYNEADDKDFESMRICICLRLDAIAAGYHSSAHYLEAMALEESEESGGAAKIDSDIIINLMMSGDVRDAEIMRMRSDEKSKRVREFRRQAKLDLSQPWRSKRPKDGIRHLSMMEEYIDARSRHLSRMTRAVPSTRKGMAFLTEAENKARARQEVLLRVASVIDSEGQNEPVKSRSALGRIVAKLRKVWDTVTGNDDDALMKADVQGVGLPSLETGGYKRHLERVRELGLSPHGTICPPGGRLTASTEKPDPNHVAHGSRSIGKESERPLNTIIRDIREYKRAVDVDYESQDKRERILRKVGVPTLEEWKLAHEDMKPYLEQAVDLSYILEED